MKMKRDGTGILSLEELAKMQNELEEQAGKLQAEVSRRAAAENVPPEEVWIRMRAYRKKLKSTDDREPVAATPLKGLVDKVMENIKRRGKRNENPIAH